MATKAHWSRKLVKLNACSAAADFAKQHKSLEAAWNACERGDWMLWLLAKTGARREDIVLAACACARLALSHVKPGEERPLRAIETAERWARGEEGVTQDQVRADAAYATVDAAAAAAAAEAAYAAGFGAYAAAADAAAAEAAYAAYAAGFGAYAYAAYAYARQKTFAACARLVRERFPSPPAL